MAVQPENFAMIIIILVDLLALTAAQSVTESMILDPTNCLNTVVTLSSCTSMLDKQKSCAHIDNPSSQADCYCQQSVLNYMAGCHQQMWDCFPNSMIDGLFEGTTGFYYSWFTVCQEVLTFSPTTMVVTKPPAYDQEDCLSYALDCDSLTVAMTSCNSAYNTPGTDLNSCLCNEDMLYWGSRCDIDANQSCLRKTLDPTAVYSNQYCERTAQSGSASRTSPASSSTVSRLEPTSSYVPPAPSSVAGAGAAATSGPTGSGMARQAVDRSSATAAFALVVAVFFA